MSNSRRTFEGLSSLNAGYVQFTVEIKVESA